jgi:hypothetical protein
MRALLILAALATPMVVTTRSGDTSRSSEVVRYNRTPATVAKSVKSHSEATLPTYISPTKGKMHAGNQPDISRMIYKR